MAGQIPSKPNTFPPADNKIKSSEMNANFDLLYNMFDPSNIGIYNLNIHANADIAATKIKDTAIVRTPSGLATPVTQNIAAATGALGALALQAGAAVPTVNVLQILNSGGTQVAGFDYLGKLLFGTTTTYIYRDGDNLKFRDVNLGAIYTLQDLVSSGVAADAAQATKGIVYLSLDPVSATSPIAVGANDNRVDFMQVKSPVSTTALKVDVMAGIAMIMGVRVEYAGTTDETMTDSATNYVEIDSAGSLSVNQVGFTAGEMPLATVVASGGAVTSITDDRPYTGFFDKAAAFAPAGAWTFADVLDITDPTKWKLNNVAYTGDMAGLNGVAALLDGSDATAKHTHSNLLDSSDTDVSISGTAEVTLYSFSLPADTLGTANGVRVEIPLSAFDVPAGHTVTFRLKYGSTALATLAWTGVADGSGGFITAKVLADGATNAQFGFLTVGVLDQLGGMKSDDGTATEDSTGALNIVVTVQRNNDAAVAVTSIGGTTERM